jgi:anti-sigma B factor antagonist
MAVAAGECGPLITMSGEADLADAAQLREVITAQLADGALYLTIDAAGLTFADSGAIGVLTGTAKSLKELGGGVILLHPQSHLIRVLTILGADQVFTILPATDISPEPEGHGEGST